MSLADTIAVWIAKRSENALPMSISGTDVEAAFGDTPRRDIEDAVAELAADGFVKVDGAIGKRMVSVRPFLDLFVTYDPRSIGSDPVEDARALIPLVLAGDDSVNVRALHAQTGWSLRRFNPALGLVVGQVDERRVSKSADREYVAGFFFLEPTDRVELTRYLQQIGG